jgi:predicted amidohydrolase
MEGKDSLMAQRKMKVAAIQTGTLPGSSKPEKIQQAVRLVAEASRQGNRVIVLPELVDTDYEKFCTKDPAYFQLAESIPGPTTAIFGEISRKHMNYIVVPLFERATAGLFYNAAATIGPNGVVISNYRKTHVAGVQVLEKLYFRNGQDLKVWSTEDPAATIGTIICHDRRYPETARILEMLGAEVMLCPTAAPDYASGVYWDLLNRMRSVDTGMFTVYANRAGTEWKSTYFGGSMIVNPFGEVLASAGSEANVIVSAELDLDLVEEARIAVPTIRDLRHELYVKYYRRPGYDDATVGIDS